MAEIRQYNSGTAFRTALEERLKRISREEGVDLQRLRRQVAFDRFLARLFHSPCRSIRIRSRQAPALGAEQT